MQSTLTRAYLGACLAFIAALCWPTQASAQQCTPPCRAGFICHQGRCISACNPPCPADQECTSTGECVAKQAPPPPPAGQCNPACQPGFECAQGQCKPLCNPPCSADQICNEQHECVAAGPTAPTGPPPVLDSGAPADRIAAVERVARERLMQYEPEVARLADGFPVPAVRAAAARALGQLGNQQRVGLLQKLAQSDAAPEVRQAASQALAQLQSTQPAPPPTAPGTTTPPPPPPGATPPTSPPPVVVEPEPAMIETAPNWTFVITGGSLFVVGYLTTVFTSFGACGEGDVWTGCDENGLSLIPVIGPFAMAAHDQTAASYVMLMVVTGLMETAGVTLGVIGALTTEKTPVEDPITVGVVPHVDPHSAGASVVGTF